MSQVIKRNNSLDALRGIAILLMVLSGSIAFGILPGWMYHAQVPPPTHVFKPEVPGITWVDLVFPFFLFSMGAAIPLAMKRKIETSTSKDILLAIVKRFILLVIFALFTMHARAWVLSGQPGVLEYSLSIICFFLLFAIYGDFSKLLSKVSAMAIKIVGFVAAGLIMLYGFSDDKTFNIYNPDIIMLVLANMALFGTLIWWITAKNVWLRLGILPFIMAVFLVSKEPGTLNTAIFSWTPAAWLYKFYYLKYLFIILPSTLVGEWIIEGQKEGSNVAIARSKFLAIATVSFVLVLQNVICLYNRELEVNFISSILLVIVLICLAVKLSKTEGKSIVVKMIYAGSYLLLLGLFFEAYEGGIKKDYSTYSYYFVCTGLAFFSLTMLHILEKLALFSKASNILAMVGKNPMVAYTAGNLLLIPVLRITQTEAYLNSLETGFWGGLLRGVIFTAIVAIVTIWATKRKIFWKT